MPLTESAKFLHMQDAGIVPLPPEAEVVHAMLADDLKKGDFVKLKVSCVCPVHGVLREGFWAEFYCHVGDEMRVVVNNDLVLSKLHGLYNGEVLEVPREFLIARMSA